MIVLGIVLIVLGVLIAAMTSGWPDQLGRLLAGIGLALVVFGVILAVLDDADTGGDLDAVLAPLGLGWAALRGRLALR